MNAFIFRQWRLSDVMGSVCHSTSSRTPREQWPECSDGGMASDARSASNASLTKTSEPTCTISALSAAMHLHTIVDFPREHVCSGQHNLNYRLESTISLKVHFAYSVGKPTAGTKSAIHFRKQINYWRNLCVERTLRSSYRGSVDKIQLQLTLQWTTSAGVPGQRRMGNRNIHFSRNSVRKRRRQSTAG